MRVFLLCIVFAFLTSRQISAGDNTALNFGMLTHSDVKKITEEDVDTVCKALLKATLAEADRRKVAPGVRDYLERSFYQWEDDAKTFTGVWQSKATPQVMRSVSKSLLKDILTKPYYLDYKHGKYGTLVASAKVFQVVDEQSALIEIYDEDVEKRQLIWLSGINAKPLVDDMELPVTFFSTNLWTQIGTKQYATALGATKTVPEIQHYKLDFRLVLQQEDLFHFGKNLRVMEEFAKVQLRRNNLELLRKENTRTWQDSTGKFSITAEFGGMIGETVKLKKSDGSVIELPISRLSDKDQKWIQQKIN